MVTYYSGQYQEIGDIFYAAIHQTAADYYTTEQINAWAPLPIKYDRWQARCELKRPFVYLNNNKVVGFLELDADGHVDCHYVHPDFNRQGIGGKLLQHVIQVAEKVQLDRLYVEASHVAKGLYLKNGFQVVRPNIVVCQGVELENFIMERNISNRS